MNTIERHESQVRGYCRAFPVMFDTAEGVHLTTEDGKRYLDFFAGAGVLNYGHNHPQLKIALLDYIERNGVTHSLDMFTTAKRTFLERFNEVILKPRGLDYKVQFPGPTGTNAVEAALKLARKVTGRERIIAFTNGFHGMTLGSLSVTGNSFKRAGAGVPLGNVTAVPFDGYLGDSTDTLAYLEAMLDDAGSGIDKPAAVILETVQAEGGVNVASFDWLTRLAKLLKRHEILLIVDDVQVGCGRTGPFFSFEPAGIKPDIVCLSKSLSGYGLPFAVVLMKPEHDVWEPGEHNGTFRGHNPAFVTAAAALDFWADDRLTKGVEAKAAHITERLQAIAKRVSSLGASARGRGLIQGLAFEDKSTANAVSGEAFKRGLIIETAGIDDEVLKLLPPLTISEEELDTGLDIIEASVMAVAEAASQERSVA
ncbi:MAG TPA: diaminobutyrate--2-oxoglutarate transaminase [Gammaproteobacteria bacterium]|nr:diaminobutyrate--2-oxoglutarate transaminase [Gammaproteobacteria bacterium]